MSKLKELMERSKKVEKEMIPITVRLSQELVSNIDELAQHLDVSRQRMMTVLIEEGIDCADKHLLSIEQEELEQKSLRFHLEQEEPEQESLRFHLVNTNKRYNLTDHHSMLGNGEAAAFYKLKGVINKIQKGDVVFLYGNAEGIVAYGHGTGETLVRDYYGDPDETHYQILENFHKLKKPMPLKKIWAALGRKIVLLRTRHTIRDGEKVLDEIIQNHI